jgi:hypothetical protein
MICQNKLLVTNLSLVLFLLYPHIHVSEL